MIDKQNNNINGEAHKPHYIHPNPPDFCRCGCGSDDTWEHCGSNPLNYSEFDDEGMPQNIKDTLPEVRTRDRETHQIRLANDRELRLFYIETQKVNAGFPSNHSFWDCD